MYCMCTGGFKCPPPTSVSCILDHDSLQTSCDVAKSCLHIHSWVDWDLKGAQRIFPLQQINVNTDIILHSEAQTSKWRNNNQNTFLIEGGLSGTLEAVPMIIALTEFIAGAVLSTVLQTSLLQWWSMGKTFFGPQGDFPCGFSTSGHWENLEAVLSHTATVSSSYNGLRYSVFIQTLLN